jgi:hypothetical protein
VFNFSSQTKYESPNSLVPNGTLAKVTIKIRGLKNSKETGGEYADLELVLQGQYENRRVFTMIANPMDSRNGEKWRGMGMAAIQHICEAAGIFKLDDEASYQRFANAAFVDVLKVIDGRVAAVKVEKGKDGHQDKNTVAEWLSPNPLSSTSKAWRQLVEGNAENFSGANTGFVTQTDTSAFGVQTVANGATAAAENPSPHGAATNTAPNWLA